MPPKRKTAPAGSAEENGTSKTKGGRAKAAKTAATTTTNGVTKGGRSRKAKAVEAEEEPAEFNEARCLEWFKSYTGLEDEDFGAHQIGPNGISKLCDDIGISLAAIDILVLAHKLEADTMPIFKEDEWTKGMKKLEVDSSKKLKVRLQELVTKLKEPQEFKGFYRYVFMFVKDSEQKCMAIDTAIGILGTVLGDRRHVKSFLEFLEEKRPIKVINRDQWYSLLDFTESVAEDFSDYDETNSAWPVLFDDYIEWKRKSA
ncbi:DCN1-like protein 4 [Actinomortierella ambigua]|uniref:Defective in cullin neddylation protein n=1 Tax=Actinomortierella ambigua TaxID=1343610 RepID=A0A9P6U5P3_9FUNG|nr:DCN1-like protein 4 [Actinomortierella ambigua]